MPAGASPPDSPLSALLRGLDSDAEAAYASFISSHDHLSRFPEATRKKVAAILSGEDVRDPQVVADLDRGDLDGLFDKYEAAHAGSALGLSGRTLLRHTAATVREAYYPPSGVSLRRSRPRSSWHSRTPSRCSRSRPPPRSRSPEKAGSLAKAISRLAKASRRIHHRRDDRDPSEDSDLEPGDYFDLGAALHSAADVRGAASALEPSWFGDLTRLQRLAKARHARLDSKVPFLASTGIELWSPSWVGLGLPRHARKSLVAHREKGLDTASKLLSNASCFWLSHFAVGEVSLAAVLAHLLLLLRISDERSSNFAQRYALLFHERLKDRIKASEHFSLDEAISTKDSVVWQRLLEERPLYSTPPPPDGRKGNGRGTRTPGPAQDPPFPPTMPNPVRLHPPAGGRRTPAHPGSQLPLPPPPAGPPPPLFPPAPPANGRAEAPQPPQSSGGRPPRRQHVCFDHDPLHGKTCPNQANCPHDHLDTRKPELALRWASAKESASKRKAPPS